MFKNLIYYTAAYLLLICACKEANTNKTTTSGDKEVIEKQIVSITYGSDPNVEKWYEYNEAGDFTRHGAYIDTIMYGYSKNKITKKYNKKSNTIQSSIVYTTDDAGMIVSSEIYDENDKMASQYHFEYDADKYLSKLKEKNMNSGRKYEQTYTYKDGNIHEIQSLDALGKIGSRYVYGFYPDKLNNLNLFNQQILDDVFPNERLGKKNKNLIRQLSYIDFTGDTLSLIKYEYMDEGDKNILVQKETDVLNESETIIRYHFKKFKE